MSMTLHTLSSSRPARHRRWLAAAVLAFVGLPTIARAEIDPKTDRLWRSKCASCHGADGKAATEQGQKMGVRDLTTAAWQKEFSDDQIRAATNDGIKRERDGKKQEMEGYKNKLRPDQIEALVKHIRALAAK